MNNNTSLMDFLIVSILALSLISLLSLLSRTPCYSILSLSYGLLLYSNYSPSFVTYHLYTPYCLVQNNRLCRYKQCTLYALVHQFFLSHWCPRLVVSCIITSSFYLTGVPAHTCFCVQIHTHCAPLTHTSDVSIFISCCCSSHQPKSKTSDPSSVFAIFIKFSYTTS